MKSSPTQDITKYIGQLYECNGGQCTKYIFAGTKRIAQVKGADTYYFHTDHLESSTVITDQNGNKVEELLYYPFGERLTDTGSANVKYKFAGHEFDAETELVYMGARYYDPKLARFISADTVVQFPFNPQSLNRYSYTLNNPVVIRELDGHCGESAPPCPPPPPSSPSGLGSHEGKEGAVEVAVANAEAAKTDNSNKEGARNASEANDSTKKGPGAVVQGSAGNKPCPPEVSSPSCNTQTPAQAQNNTGAIDAQKSQQEQNKIDLGRFGLGALSALEGIQTMAVAGTAVALTAATTKSPTLTIIVGAEMIPVAGAGWFKTTHGFSEMGHALGH